MSGIDDGAWTIMNLPTKTGFRLLILFEIFLRIAWELVDYLTDSTMPEALRNFRYDNWYEDAPAIVLAISIGFLEPIDN